MPTWTSPRRAALRAVLAATTVLSAAGCGSSQATPSGSGPAASVGGSVQPAASLPVAIPAMKNLTLEADRAVGGTIGPDGGVLETRDAHGVVYRLELPRGAVRNAVAIAIVPITAVTGLPAGAAVGGGLHLEPDGLRLHEPATLSVTLPAPPSGGVLPFAYHADLEEPYRYPTARDGGTTTFTIVHFSGYALLQATAQGTAAADIGLRLPWQPPTAPGDAALARIASVLDDASAERDRTITGALRTWLDALRPMVAAFRQVTAWDLDGPFADAASRLRNDFVTWDVVRKLLVLAGVTVDPQLDRDWGKLANTLAVHAFGVTNSNCAASTTGELLVLRIPELSWWQSLGALVDPRDRDPSLAPTFLVEHACARPVFHPQDGTTFPSGVQPGQSGTLAIHGGIRVDGSQVRYDAALAAAITPRGTQPSGARSGPTSASGELQTTWQWDPGATELRLDVRICLPEPATSPICADATVVRGTRAACPSFRITIRGQSAQGSGPVSTSGGYANFNGAMVNLAGEGTGDASIKSVFKVRISGATSVQGTITVRVKIQDFTSPSQTGARSAAANVTGAASFSTTSVGDTTREFPVTLVNGDTLTFDGALSASAAANTGIAVTLEIGFKVPQGTNLERGSC